MKPKTKKKKTIDNNVKIIFNEKHIYGGHSNYNNTLNATDRLNKSGMMIMRSSNYSTVENCESISNTNLNKTITTTQEPFFKTSIYSNEGGDNHMKFSILHPVMLTGGQSLKTSNNPSRIPSPEFKIETDFK